MFSYVVLGLIVLAGVWALIIYNGLVGLRQTTAQANADIDVQLKMRADLIPNLIETVKGYAAHEKSTLDAVVSARAAVMSARDPQQQAQAQGELSGALGRLMAVAESYPDLKANGNFQLLQEQLADIEAKLAAARRFFNNAAAEYNAAMQAFPAVLFARKFGFIESGFYQNDPAQKAALDEPPGVKFWKSPAMFQAFGLTTHIRANRNRSVVLLVGLFAMSFVLAYGLLLIVHGVGDLQTAQSFGALLHVAGRQLLIYSPIVVGVTALWALVGTRMSQSLIDMATKARQPSSAELRKLSDLLENLCISRGLTAPRLAIIDDAALNAYASGLSEGHYAITVTSGLLETLDKDEIEAVLAHELTHVRNEDVRLMTFAGVIVGGFAFISDMVGHMNWRFSGSSDKNGKSGFIGVAAVLLGIALVILAWASARLISLSLSRQREYLADAGSVELTKNPDAMISALRKISGNSALARAPAAVMDMCIDNPQNRWLNLMSTHPSIEARIEALKTYAGGLERDAGLPAKPSFAALMRRGAARLKVPTPSPEAQGAAPASALNGLTAERQRAESQDPSQRGQR